MKLLSLLLLLLLYKETLGQQQICYSAQVCSGQLKRCTCS